MRKRTIEKCLAAFLTGLLVATVPSAIASGHLADTPLETNQIAVEKTQTLLESMIVTFITYRN